MLFALRRESMYFRRRFRPFAACDAPCWARWCGAPDQPILLVETGMGGARVHAALDWLLQDSRRPGRIAFAGFGGSLSPSVGVGAVVWATAVLDHAGQVWPTTWRQAHQPAGLILSLQRLAPSARDKRALGSGLQALTIDMESGAIAQRCSETGVPFACVRAVSDDVDTDLSPELAALLTTGVVSPWRLTRTLLRRPGLVFEMLRLERDTRAAARELARVLQCALTPS